MFDRLYRVRPTCLGCGVRFERDAGSWLVALVLTYTFAILVLVVEALLLLPRYGLFDGIEWIGIGTGAITVILSYQPIKGASIWFLWASGVVTRDGETEVTPGKRLGGG